MGTEALIGCKSVRAKYSRRPEVMGVPGRTGKEKIESTEKLVSKEIKRNPRGGKA